MIHGELAPKINLVMDVHGMFLNVNIVELTMMMTFLPHQCAVLAEVGRGHAKLRIDTYSYILYFHMQ